MKSINLAAQNYMIVYIKFVNGSAVCEADHWEHNQIIDLTDIDKYLYDIVMNAITQSEPFTINNDDYQALVRNEICNYSGNFPLTIEGFATLYVQDFKNTMS